MATVGRRSTSRSPATGPDEVTPETIYVATHPGLERTLERELVSDGIAVRETEIGGAVVVGPISQVYRLNVACRTATRVLVRVGEFHARSFPELERHARKVPWERFLTPGSVAHLRITAKKSRLNHERAIAERLERALCERVARVTFMARRGEVDEDEREVTRLPSTQRFVVRLSRDRCTISADSSGALLHRRGYRLDGGKAPLRETLAAGMLLAAGWDGTVPLVDPMCGSGTIPIEAALIARRIPPGRNRRFAFERWPSFDSAGYQAVLAELTSLVREAPPAPIHGSDRDAGAIESAIANAERAGVGESVSWRRGALSSIDPPEGTGLLITNPPYGARLGPGVDLRDLYAQLGHVLRRKLPGWTAVLLSADRRLDAQVGLSWQELARAENGGLAVRVITASVPDIDRR